MNKLLTIRAMKEKLLQMQEQLNRGKQKSDRVDGMELDKKYQAQFLKQYSSNPQERCSPSNLKWKNPTFWGNNPIFGENPKLINSSPKKSREKQKQLSPQFCSIMRSNDQNYYKEVSKEKPKVSKCWQEKEEDRKTPRFTKIRTYERKRGDPILQPDAFQLRGKKIDNRKNKLSPNSLLINNPDSDPNLFYVGERTIKLSPATKNNKNLSPNLKNIFSSTYSSTSPHNSSKKHFPRSFKDMYHTNWC